MALIELININKKFQDGENKTNHVLRNLNLQVQQGDFIAVKGQSGAGKTTLLNILGTLLVPDEGVYLLNGQSLIEAEVDLAEIRNRQIGFVFQDHRLLPQYNVLQNILLPTLAFSDKSKPAEVERAYELMRLTHIENLKNQYPNTLSGGEACRVAVCRALINRPLLLLADEPTGQLDKENSQNVASLFQMVNETLHTTIIMVTHSDETSAAAKRTVVLSDGKIVD